MTTTPLTDQQLADGHLLDLIQAEVDSKPPHYYRFNGGLYVPKVLTLAQALRADRDRLAAELQRANADRSELADQLSSANEAEDELEAELSRARAELEQARQHTADAERMRDFHARSAEHIARKRDRAEQLIVRWREGDIATEVILTLVSSALAVATPTKPPPPPRLPDPEGPAVTPPRIQEAPVPDMTMAQADIYLDLVDDALTAAGIRPDHFDSSDCDEYADDGITTVPSAVLTWDTSELLMVGSAHGRLEDGVLVAWDASRGWVIAEMNPDGSNGPLEPLPMPVTAEPGRVAAVIASAVLAQPLTVNGEPDGAPWAWKPAQF